MSYLRWLPMISACSARQCSLMRSNRRRSLRGLASLAACRLMRLAWRVDRSKPPARSWFRHLKSTTRPSIPLTAKMTTSSRWPYVEKQAQSSRTTDATLPKPQTFRRGTGISEQDQLSRHISLSCSWRIRSTTRTSIWTTSIRHCLDWHLVPFCSGDWGDPPRLSVSLAEIPGRSRQTTTEALLRVRSFESSSAGARGRSPDAEK